MKRIILYCRFFWIVGVWWFWKVFFWIMFCYYCSMIRSIERRFIVSRVVEL